MPEVGRSLLMNNTLAQITDRILPDYALFDELTKRLTYIITVVKCGPFFDNRDTVGRVTTPHYRCYRVPSGMLFAAASTTAYNRDLKIHSTKILSTTPE